MEKTDHIFPFLLPNRAAKLEDCLPEKDWKGTDR
jgi:hypothetical protein